MKKNVLLYAALAAAGIYLLTRKRRPGYTLTVEPPQKISEAEYLRQTREAERVAKRQRALDVARKAVEYARQLAEKKLAQKKTLGNFY